MGLITRFKNAKTAFKSATNLFTIQSDGNFINGIGGITPYWTDTSSAEAQINAFNRCPSLSAIIAKKVRSHLNGKYYFIDSNGKESTNKYALYLKKLFSNPNCLQTWNQFEAQAKVYIQIFGECYLLPVFPTGFDGDKKTAIWLLKQIKIIEIRQNEKSGRGGVNSTTKMFLVGLFMVFSWLGFTYPTLAQEQVPEEYIIQTQLTQPERKIELPTAPEKKAPEKIPAEKQKEAEDLAKAMEVILYLLNMCGGIKF